MFGLGFNEIVLIGIFVIVFFYGSTKLVDFARSMGKVTGEFKKGKLEAENEFNEIMDATNSEGKRKGNTSNVVASKK